MPEPLRIAYFINSMEGGGAQSPLPRIVRALENAGSEVRVFALARRNGLAIPRLREEGLEPIVREGGESDHLSALRWMERQATEFRADAIWTSLTRATLLGQVVGKRLGLPVVSWQHNAFLKPWNERLLRWRAAASDVWVADSSQVADLTRQRLGVPEKDLVTWSIFAADPAAPQAVPWQPGESLQLGSLGRLHPAKGYDLLIDALALLNARGFNAPVPFNVRIGGIGGDAEALMDRAKAAGVDSIDFVGFVADSAQFLAGLHLYLQPSRREGFCIAAHEAMQAGLPVIAARTGEMPHTIADPSMGRTFPVGDVEALADALAELLSSPGELAAMGQRLRQNAFEKFSEAQFYTVGAELVRRIRAIAPVG